jgi:ABC-2 type transport system permease protein
MSQVLLIARREISAYSRSPLGAIVVAGALLIDGIYFYWQGLTEKLVSAQVLTQFFYGASGTTMIAGIVLAMRLLAEERQTGTLTLLNTSPIKDSEIVLGKFVSAFAVLAVMTLLTIYMPLLIFVNGKVSVGHIVVGYSGLLLLGAASLSIGLFASAVARSQVVAAIIGALILTPLVLLWALAKAVDPPLNTFLSALAIHHENFKPFMDGIFQLEGVVYYIAVTYFFLLAATKTLEARRWR